MSLSSYRTVTFVLAVSLTLAGCLQGNEITAPDVTPTPAPVPTPTPSPVPVEISATVTLTFNESDGSQVATNLNGTDFQIANTFRASERVAGVEGTGLRTDGFSTWAQGALDLTGAQEMTVQTWLALESYPADAEVPHSQLTPSSIFHQATSSKGFSLDVNAFGQWAFKVVIDGVAYTLNAPDLFPLYQWVHVAAVVDGFNGNIRLYLNGEQIAIDESNPVGGTISAANTDFTVGKGVIDKSLGIFPVINGINGVYDLTEVYVGARETDDIAAQYNTELAAITSSAELALQVPDSRFINDLQRPTYHAMPPSAWANEPHGLVEFDGKFHMFYQRTPNGPFKTLMHWGHMASPDFVNWSHLKDALWPEVEQGGTQGSDMKGIWSGDVVVDGDTAYAFYTSVNHAGAFNPGVSVATSSATDLQDWTKLGPIIDRTGADDMRDPYLWKEGDTWHMIIGAIKGGRGYLLHYSTQTIADSSSWVKSDFTTLDNFSAMGPDNTLWEMPIFEKISDDKYVLLVNPVGAGYRPRGLYWVGSWLNGQFVPDSTEGKFLDLLLGHISPALARNSDGQITAIGIVDERRSSEAQLAAGWTQTFSAPRVWGLADDNATITQQAASELTSLRIDGSLRAQSDLTVNGETELHARGRHVEIIAQLDASNTANKYGLVIAASADGQERTVIYYNVESKSIVLEKSKSSLSPAAHELTEQVGAYDEAVFGKPEKFHVFIDGSVVDVFINDKAAFSFRIYPTLTDSKGIALYSQAADTNFTQVEVYQLRDMQSNRTYIGAASDTDGIVEEMEHGEIITLTVTNNRLVDNLELAQWSISGLPAGVTIASIARVDDTHAEITLAGNTAGDFDTDLSKLILSVDGSQFAQAQLPKIVTTQAPVIQAQVEVVTNANLTVMGNAENQITEGSEAGKQINVVLINNTFTDPLNKDHWIANNLPAGLDFTLTRISDTEIGVEFIGTPEGYANEDRLVTFSISADAFSNADPELFGQPAMSTSVKFVANKIYNVTLAADGQNNALVIGRFDGAQTTLLQGWAGVGDFANPVSEFSWRGTTANSASAQIGEGAVSTCEMNGNAKGCDGNVGRLTSPIFTLSEDNLVMLLTGGESNQKAVGIRVLDTVGNLLHNYSPASCGPANIDGDDDWTVINVSVLVGASIRAQFYDEESGSCGFVSFDHLYQSSETASDTMIDGGTVLLTESQSANLTYRVSLPYQDSDENVIGSFDDAQAMIAAGWTATGVFSDPASPDTWHSLTTTAGDAARVGAGGMTTCEIGGGGCDNGMGTLTSPEFAVTVEKSTLALLISGGNPEMNNDVGIRVLDAADNELMRLNPGTCGDAYVKNDSNWKTLDLSAYVNQKVKVQVFDNESGGCGFISVDHVHMTSMTAIDPSAVDFNYIATDIFEVNPDQTLDSVTVTADAFNQVIGSFDNALDTISNGWIATGDFANPLNTDAWQGTTVFEDAAKVGLRAVSSCELINNAAGCDAPVGSLTSPTFKVDASRTNLNFLMSGGNGSAPVGLKVTNPANGASIAQHTPNSCGDSRILGDQHWVSLNLSDWVGQYVQVVIFDNEAGTCGFVSFDHLNMSATAR
jgi:sucrose-6-phosphate hydrolase SacC (GH32 family)